MDKHIFVPPLWINELEHFKVRPRFLRPYHFVPYPKPYDKFKASDRARLLELQKIQSVMWVLPNSFTHPSKANAWPRLLLKTNNFVSINAFVFADNLEELAFFLEKCSEDEAYHSNQIYATCQYEYPYTQTLSEWESAGAVALHPGDYYKADFLKEFREMHGTWVYFGHALEDRLRGYGHLLTNDLLENRPKSLLNASLWFTCSTLSGKETKSIGLSFFLSGATKCLLASSEAIQTDSNQRLAANWLEVARGDDNATLATLVRELALGTSVRNTLNQYFLLGNPWVNASFMKS